MSTERYSVPSEAKKVLEDGIVNNPLQKNHREELKSVLHLVTYEGSDFPKVPINWRFCESMAALKGLEASMINILNKKKYNAEPQPVVINTDHANLVYMSSLLWTINTSEGQLNAMDIFDPTKLQKFLTLFPDLKSHNDENAVYQAACNNIYKTKDGRFFYIHGGMNSEPTQKMLGLPISVSTKDRLVCNKMYADATAKFTSEEIQQLTSDVYGQAGTICWSIQEYKDSDHGKANAHVGLWETHYIPNATQKPSWWASVEQTSAQRPLAGLKVIDVTRILAAPTVSRTLAGYGASVMHIISPNIDDMTVFLPDVGWGKWNAFVDLKTDIGKQTLRELIAEADVFLIGYRPNVLDKYGFSKQDILDLVADRPKGIIYAQENSYGWNGPWSYRTGWQPISDANCGVSLEFGRAMGHNEPVTPIFPNTDYGSGVAGACGVLDALMQRAETGGSYVVDIALNYYSQWLINSVGVYPETVWQELWSQHGRMIFHSGDNKLVSLPAVMDALRKNHIDLFTNPAYYTIKHNNVFNTDFRIVKDCIQWPPGSVDFDYRIGTRANGVDQPRWPKDLTVEIVTTTN
jgi:crotonobetainyl-CoA:carnitine CoA-transferase CaiB-like acyl-CoA transferase